MSMSLSGDAFERAVLENTVADLAADGSELCDTTPWGRAAIGEVIIGYGGDD